MTSARNALFGAALAGLLTFTGTAVVTAPTAGADPVADTFAPAAAPVEFFNLVNVTRAGVGVPALGYDAGLSAYAQAQAQAMANAGTIFHSDITALMTAYGYSTVGENVGVGPSAVAINGALNASPSHYANLISSGFTAMGVGVAVGANGMIYTAHEFAA